VILVFRRGVWLRDVFLDVVSFGLVCGDLVWCGQERRMVAIWALGEDQRKENVRINGGNGWGIEEGQETNRVEAGAKGKGQGE